MGRFMARPKPDEGIGGFDVSLEDMMKFKTIKLLPKISNLLSVCCQVGFMTV
jgi:hypothetical protein